MTNKSPLDAASLKKLPNLKYIGVLATGYNIVDAAAAKQQEIRDESVHRVARSMARASNV